MFETRFHFSVIGVIIFLDAAMSGHVEIMRMALGIVTSKEHFPYLCTVVYGQEWVGACSILTKEIVIVSLSNLNRPITEMPDERRHYYNDLEGLAVYAGSVYMNPSLYGVGSIPGLQKTNVNRFYIPYDADDLSQTKELKADVNNGGFDLDSILKKDVVNAALNVAFLKVYPFQWTSSVRPLPLSIDADLVQQKTTASITQLEDFPYSNSACKIAAWHYPTKRKVFHHVLYIPKAMCKRAYCNYNLNACLTFPNKDYHVCFKSAYWGEPCSADTGAALFCQFFGGGNIFAILTTAINCGNDNLPCVYTTMTPVLQVYESIWGKYTPPAVP